MPLDLVAYKMKAQVAIKRSWKARHSGSRTSAPNAMAGFVDLVIDVVCANGLARANVLRQDQSASFPGYFSATQSWDLAVLNGGRLIAAVKIDYLSVAALSADVGCDYNKVLGGAMELQAAYRSGAFGKTRPPFVGYLILLEDAPTSRKPVKDVSPNFPLFPEFRGASYAERYNILCRKLVAENLYSAASVILSPRTSSKSGSYSEMSELTGLKLFVTTLAGHIAAEAAM